MKRRRIITQAIVFIIAGAILNVAMAWGTAIFFPLDVITSNGIIYNDPTFAPRWVVGICTRRGALVVSSSAHFDRPEFRYTLPDDLPDWSMAHVPPTAHQASAGVHVTEHAYGWPSLSLFHRKSSSTGLGLPFPRRSSVRWLPFVVIWPGFAINTIFYAAILWLLFAAPFVIRKRRRIKRGLCPACAYPVGANELCTECGKQVKPRSVEPSA